MPIKPTTMAATAAQDVDRGEYVCSGAGRKFCTGAKRWPQRVIRYEIPFREVKERVMANPLALITSLANGKNSNEFKGVVKQDWVATGRIDFATKLESNADADQPSEFRLLVEERRIIESVAGNENLEIQWRPATLKEAKFITTHYHKYLAENSLIKSPFEPDILPPELKEKSK